MGGTKKDQDIETETKDIKTMFYKIKLGTSNETFFEQMETKNLTDLLPVRNRNNILQEQTKFLKTRKHKESKYCRKKKCIQPQPFFCF